MTDTLGAQAPTQPSDQIQGLAGDIAATLRAAPELQTAPGLAVPVAQAGGDVKGNAQVVAHTSNTHNLQKGVQNVSAQTQSPGVVGKALSWLGHAGGDAVSGIEKGASVVGKELNKPLQYVQHEYRYLHDVEAKHGRLAGLAETALVVTGGLAAAALAPETGGTSIALFAGALGSEATAAALGQVSHKDSWAATENGNSYVDPNTHQPVSIGRDFASLIGEHPGSGTYKWVSGLADGLSDLGLDPLAKAGEISGAVKAGRLVMETPEDVVRAASTVGPVTRAFGAMSKMNAGDIAVRFPQFAELAPQLGRATTTDGVTQIFRNAMEINQLTGNRLPALTLTSIPIKALRGVFADTKIARGQQLLPQWFNEKTLSFTNSEFDPMSNSASIGIYRFLRGSGQVEAVARSVANNFLNADDLQQRIEIWRNSVFSAVKGLAESKGLPAAEADAMKNKEFQRRLMGQFESITGGQYPGRDSVYGFGPDGQPIPPLLTSKGNSVQAGIQLSQTGKLSFPSPQDMRAAASMVAGSSGLYGKVDDWTYDNITQKIFKRWVLLSGSFALHVSLSEDVLNALRLGTANLLRSRLASTIGKLGYKYGDESVKDALDSEERQKSIGAFLYHVLGGKVQDGPRAQFALKSALHFNGDIVSPGLSAGHTMPWNDGPPEEVITSSLRQGVRKMRFRGTDDFTGFAPGQDHYGEQTRAWQQWLHTLTKDPASAQAALVYKSWLEEHPGDIAGASQHGSEAATLWFQDHPEVHPDMLQSTLPTDGWDNMDPLDAWGKKVMLTVQGATTGVDGTVHHDLLDAIVKGHFRPRGGKPQLPNEIDRHYLSLIDSKPAKTLGRVYMPDTTGTLERIANFGFNKVISPIINFMSREPAYQETAFKHYQTLQASVEDGRLSEEDALIKSHTWASQDMIKFVHNIHEKTQLSETMRNYVPFWFAQQQAYKRVGRLLMADPGAFRKYQLLVTQLHDIGSQTTSSNGTNYITFPGSGFLGQGVPAIFSKLGIPMVGSSPVAFAGSLDSLGIIVSGATGVQGLRPGVGPIVAIPVKALAMMFPEMQTVGNAVVGPQTMNGSMFDQFVPNAFVQHVLQGLGTSSRGFNSTVMATIQTLDYEQTVAEARWVKEGRKGTEPSIVPPPTAGPIAQQDFVNRVRNQTRIMYMVRAGLGLFSPLSPQLTVQNFGFPTELSNAIAKEGSVSSGVTAFLAKHPDATPFTVFQSTEPTGSQIPASNEAEAWVNDNTSLIKQYPYAAAWLMPQLTDTKYSPAVYNEQLAQGLRQKRTPQEFLNALYVASGNYQYYTLDRPSYEKALASGQYDNSALSSDFSAFTKALGAQNPIWYDDFQSVDRTTRRTQTIQEMDQMLNGPNPPGGSMAASVRGLVNDYKTYQNAVTQKVGTKKELATDFQAYLLKVAKDSPELAPVILSVFGPATSSPGASFATAAQTAGLAS